MPEKSKTLIKADVKTPLMIKQMYRVLSIKSLILTQPQKILQPCKIQFCNITYQSIYYILQKVQHHLGIR